MYIIVMLFRVTLFVAERGMLINTRLRTHPSHLAVNLLRLPDNRRLRRFLPTDLPDRF
jgi:hypothetical protein